MPNVTKPFHFPYTFTKSVIRNLRLVIETLTVEVHCIAYPRLVKHPYHDGPEATSIKFDVVQVLHNDQDVTPVLLFHDHAWVEMEIEACEHANALFTEKEKEVFA